MPKSRQNKYRVLSVVGYTLLNLFLVVHLRNELYFGKERQYSVQNIVFSKGLHPMSALPGTTYGKCRNEFNMEKDPVCKKCTYNVKMYGQPSCCEYCNIRAALDGSKCSRCLRSEKKYGPTVSCEQCKLKCAFQKPLE